MRRGEAAAAGEYANTVMVKRRPVSDGVGAGVGDAVTELATHRMEPVHGRHGNRSPPQRSGTCSAATRSRSGPRSASGLEILSTKTLRVADLTA